MAFLLPRRFGGIARIIAPHAPLRAGDPPPDPARRLPRGGRIARAARPRAARAALRAPHRTRAGHHLARRGDAGARLAQDRAAARPCVHPRKRARGRRPSDKKRACRDVPT